MSPPTAPPEHSGADALTSGSALASPAAITVVAQRHGLPPELVIAICHTESGLNRFAMRSEPAFRWFWDVARNSAWSGPRTDTMPAGFPAPHGISQFTEWMGQQTSWGLMQVMGAESREIGFRGHFTEISDTMLGTELGCRLLLRLKDHYFAEFGWAGVVAAYNAGSPRRDGDRFVNQGYVDAVRANGAESLW